jgi:hypothetical protein
MLGRLLVLCATAALVAGSGATAGATRSFKDCGNRPTHLRFNIQAHGVTCTYARTVGKLVSQPVKVIRSHTFQYRAGRWTCRYTVFQSSKAGDGEGEIFDCHRGTDQVRWSNARGIQPHTIRP